MDIYITSCLEFLRANKDLLSLLLAPVIIPCLKFIWLNIKRFIYLHRQLRNSDSERILEFFSKEKFDKLKLEHKVIQDILIQKISVFKGYSIEKVERLLNANIGNNNSFLFFELNRLGFINDYGQITKEGYKYIGKKKLLRLLWFLWVLAGSLLIIYIEFFSTDRYIFLIIGWITLPFSEMYLLFLKDRIRQIEKFSINKVNIYEYTIEINGNIFVAKVHQN